MDTPTEQADPALPKIAGRSDHHGRLSLIIWPSFLGPLPSGPIDLELLYRNCRAHAEKNFSERYDTWEKHKCNPTRLVVCGHRTEIRADALIAAGLTTWCCAFMCEVLEYHADYLLDCAKSGTKRFRRFDQFANDLVNDTHDNKWRPGLQAIRLREEENADAFRRAAREGVSNVRHKFGRLAWNAERECTDGALHTPRPSKPPESRLSEGLATEEKAQASTAGELESEPATRCGEVEQATSGLAERPTTRDAFVTPILVKNGGSVSKWAIEAEVDFHTANNYLKGRTRTYRSTRKKLAKSLNVEP